MDFLSWFNQTHIPEDFRVELPPASEYTAMSKMKRARWIVRNISSAVHPDNFRDDLNKWTLMSNLSKVLNQLVN